MNIVLNNRPDEIPADQLTVQELLDLKKFSFKLLIVRINGSIIKKDHFHDALIHDGDDVLVLHLISGG
ncbi:MAG: sulfur carrier protein ThiS [Bacteroidota bacterium]|nr:sulfur carrier protein ThiS [Bacteroidota bacterium]